MKNLLHWLRHKFPERKSDEEILKLIDEHNEETMKASEAIDNAIHAIRKASLDGEDGWWCGFVPTKEEKRSKQNDNCNRRSS